eukprot:CAMPEP_0180222470 /NCGR_PEP_ID=MMETSP0987-20121128/20753_1 /TAXON_ID=697907 /ORGANISM="non described non described, Strain CCMP2293" /LENGTH=54 /DNA_ID=CAMNT_0022184611 /DNA_START=54 /DNA_END=215 /DNA_ORIENTATION=+
MAALGGRRFLMNEEPLYVHVSVQSRRPATCMDTRQFRADDYMYRATSLIRDSNP